MSYPAGDSSYYRRPRREQSANYVSSYAPTSRRVDSYPRHPDSYDYDSYDRPDRPASYHPRRSAPHQRSSHARPPTWPPAPTVEDETSTEGDPPADTRGTVDQDSLLDAIDPPPAPTPAPAPDNAERRFVIVPDAKPAPRRRSIAERGNLPHLQTHLDQTHVDDSHIDNDPPMVTERVSTPYSYTRPQRETTAPDFLLSPDPITPAPSARQGVFDDDDDLDPEQMTHLRTQRAPARYSFVKSDLHKEHLRTDLRNTQSSPESPKEREAPREAQREAPRESPREAPREASREASRERTREKPRERSRERPRERSRERRRDIARETPREPHRDPPREAPRRQRDADRRPDYNSGAYQQSSHPSSPHQQSPHSSSSSLNSEKRKSRNATFNVSRPASPLSRASPANSRPASRDSGGPAPPYPLSSEFTPVIDADWSTTYPPFTINDRSRPPSRLSRIETMPSMGYSSSTRPLTSNPLPYPSDDRQIGAFMPPEEDYQFDHSSIASPQQAYPDSPRVASPSISASPRLQDLSLHPSRPRTPAEIPLRARRSRTDSLRSQSSFDARPQPPGRSAHPFSSDRPLPSCPRSTPSDRYDDWYNLEGFRNFDMCPSCYEGVFAGTPFASHFSQGRRYERGERSCDFSSPWMRLGWLLTITRRRPSLELLYALGSIAETDRPCPGDREASSERVVWYGLVDPRDGIHVANFAVCSCDAHMIGVLFPSMRGYFTRLGPSYRSSQPERYTCSLRVGSRRFPKYLDLLVELEAEAATLGQGPAIGRFVQLARDNAFKGECAKSKSFVRKPWHFMAALPAFTVCEECYDEVVWPATQSASVPGTIPRLVNKSIQLVPGEDVEVGSSCCLYSPRMRRVWETSVQEQDFGYLEVKVLERKRAEKQLGRERKGIVKYMLGVDRGGREWARARDDLKSLDREWATWE